MVGARSPVVQTLARNTNDTLRFKERAHAIMSLGVHFALVSKDLRKLRRLTDPAVLVDFISEDLEGRYLENDELSFQSDKAWEPIHRALTDGTLLPGRGTFPLAFAVLGGKRLDSGEGSTVCLVEPEQVKGAALALGQVTKDWFLSRFRKLSDSDYQGPLGDKDAAATWETLQGLRAFFERAGKKDRAVLFSVDA